MVIAHLGSVPCMLAMGFGLRRPIAVAAMFGFQVLMGASSPGMYAMSQILAGPQCVGPLGRDPELARQPLGHDLDLAHRLHRDCAPGISRSPSSAAAVVSAAWHRRLDRHGAEARADQVVERTCAGSIADRSLRAEHEAGGRVTCVTIPAGGYHNCRAPLSLLPNVASRQTLRAALPAHSMALKV